jgi:YidC/Oxa1 family membrane protein insertase
MTRKLFFMAVVLLTIFGLSACGGGDDTVALVVANNPVNMSYEASEASDIVIKGEGGLSYFAITEKGTTATLSNYAGNLPTVYIEDDNGVRTYAINVEGKEATFKIYVQPETIEGNADDVVMIAFRYTQANVLYPQGEAFDPTGIEVYVVTRNGAVDMLMGEDVADQFDVGAYTPLGDDGFNNEVAYTVTFTHGGLTETFEVYQAGGERPIHTEDATFFDWILVIPVAFVMQFFAGLMGNSFALGILFTTIVVRTLAWPIYAKSNDMSIKMNLAQPDMQRIQNKYATRKDPQSQQMMQMEMMAVYKKHGISVFGCLMPFLQMPIFIAMYGVVRRISLEGGIYQESVSHTTFLGINLANTNDGITGLVLAGIVGATMFLLQQISMKKPSYAKNTGTHNPGSQAEQTQKTMKFISYFMVVMMMFISFQSNALAIYWIFGNLYSLGQTLFNRKMNEKKHERLMQKQLMG